MKKLTKVVIFMVLAAFCLNFLASCHGGKFLAPFEIPERFNERKTYDITFWAKNDQNETQQNIYNKAIEDFERLYPNINVTIKPFTNYNDIYREVLTNVQTGTTPNVCITYPDHIATYISGKNSVVPLEGLIHDERYGLGGSEVKFDSVRYDDVVPKFLEEGQIKGVQYAIPFMRSTEACYFNRDLVEALGFTVPEKLTWDFIFEVSSAAMKPVGEDENGDPIYINGKTVMVPFLYKSTDNMMIQLLKQKGYDYSNENGEILIFNDDTKDILYTVAEKVEEGTLSSFSIAGGKYPGDLMNAGLCIFGIDSTAGATWIGTNSPNHASGASSRIEYNLEVMEIPQIDPENPVMISQGPSICIFNKKDHGEVLASWLFAQYLLTNEVQIAYSQTEGYVPVTSKAQQSEEYLDYLSKEGQLDENGNSDFYYAPKIQASKLLLRNIDNTFITPVFNGSASLRNVAGMLIDETGKAVKRDIEINDAQLDAIFKKASSQYSLGSLEIADRKKPELDKMPLDSIFLLAALGVTWVGIGGYAVVSSVVKRKKHKQ